MTKAVIDLLNKAFAIEPKTINELAQYRVACSQQLADAELLCVLPDEHLVDGWQISVLGLINTILAALKLPPVALKVSEITPDVEHERVYGFCEYTPPASQEPVTPQLREVFQPAPSAPAVGPPNVGYYNTPPSQQAAEVTVHRGENLTVFTGQSEVIVYGGGSDWMVQYSQVTNYRTGWRKWFAHRDEAERHAHVMASAPYAGDSEES